MLSTTVGKKLNKYVPDYVVFDLETTGTSCKSDAVIEISAVKVKNGQVVDEFSIHSFDMKFIMRDAQNYWGKAIGNDYIDTLQMARQLLPELSHHRLVDLAEHYGISSDGAHRALNDCRMNQKVFEHLRQEMAKASGKGLVICPKCGQVMKKRNGKFGEFLGCSGYPNCRFTRNI